MNQNSKAWLVNIQVRKRNWMRSGWINGENVCLSEPGRLSNISRTRAGSMLPITPYSSWQWPSGNDIDSIGSQGWNGIKQAYTSRYLPANCYVVHGDALQNCCRMKWQELWIIHPRSISRWICWSRNTALYEGLYSSNFEAQIGREAHVVPR